MSVYPAAPDPIDWEYYKAKISKPGFVDSFKKQVSFCVVSQVCNTIVLLSCTGLFS